MTAAPEPTRHQDVSAAAQRILELGESGRYEFKRDVDVVSPKLLAALANWVALDPSRESACLMVGVEEVEDAESGLTYGLPHGLPKGLDRAVARVQDMASKTRPVPVDAFVVEEGVSTPTPFLRVVVRPTMPPHFDDEGRRQTRQGRSTRALTDEELLSIYLDREAGSFAMRFRQTTSEMQGALGAMGDTVQGIAEGIEKDIVQPLQHLTATTQEAADAAASATSSADSAAYEIENVQRLVQGVEALVEQVRDDSPQNVAARVISQRRWVWWVFTVDTVKHRSALATRLSDRLHQVLDRDVSLDPAHNGWELAVWRHLLDGRKSQRDGRGTQKWWDASIKEALLFMDGPAYPAPDLPDLRAALHVDPDAELEDPQSTLNRFRRLLKPE